EASSWPWRLLGRQGRASPAGGMPGHQTRTPESALSSKIVKVRAEEGKVNSFRKETFPEAKSEAGGGPGAPGTDMRYDSGRAAGQGSNHADTTNHSPDPRCRGHCRLCPGSPAAVGGRAA